MGNIEETRSCKLPTRVIATSFHLLLRKLSSGRLTSVMASHLYKKVKQEGGEDKET